MPKSMPARLALSHGRGISLLVAVLVSILLLIAPLYSDGKTLAQVNGPRAFGVLAIPVVIAVGPMAIPWLKIPAAIAMLVFALLAGFSIGLFYLPVAALLLWPERP
jgi:hypothetical protein